MRSKIFILLTFSVAVFFVNGRGLSLLFAIFAILVIFDYFLEFKDRPLEFASILKAVLKVALPLYIICIISFLANAVQITGDSPSNPYSLVPNPSDTDVYSEPSAAASMPDTDTETPTSNPYSLVPNPLNALTPNPLGITLTGDGILRGAFYSGRILLLGWSSLYVANTVSLIEFAAVFKWMFWPLRKFKVPVQDASLAVSIALRFIPEIFFEFQNIREAQWCRGAKMTSGGLVARTRAHAGCFVPLIVRMMANVDNLSDALTARCWGVYEVSPKEEMDQVSPVQVAFTAIVCILICSVAVLV